MIATDIRISLRIFYWFTSRSVFARVIVFMNSAVFLYAISIMSCITECPESDSYGVTCLFQRSNPINIAMMQLAVALIIAVIKP